VSDEIKAKIMDLVTNARKKQKPGDLAKKLSAEMGVQKSDVKKAIKELVSDEKLIFTYYGSSYVELPGADQPQAEEAEE